MSRDPQLRAPVTLLFYNCWFGVLGCSGQCADAAIGSRCPPLGDKFGVGNWELADTLLVTQATLPNISSHLLSSGIFLAALGIMASAEESRLERGRGREELAEVLMVSDGQSQGVDSKIMLFHLAAHVSES